MNRLAEASKAVAGLEWDKIEPDAYPRRRYEGKERAEVLKHLDAMYDENLTGSPWVSSGHPRDENLDRFLTVAATKE